MWKYNLNKCFTFQVALDMMDGFCLFVFVWGGEGVETGFCCSFRFCLLLALVDQTDLNLTEIQLLLPSESWNLRQDFLFICYLYV